MDPRKTIQQDNIPDWNLVCTSGFVYYFSGCLLYREEWLTAIETVAEKISPAQRSSLPIKNNRKVSLLLCHHPPQTDYRIANPWFGTTLISTASIFNFDGLSDNQLKILRDKNQYVSCYKNCQFPKFIKGT